MSDINYDACAAKLLELLKKSWNNDVNICDDYDLWESLTADTLSPSETRLLAEHLKNCPACRQRCADAHELNALADSPLYARMRAYKANPASETDENWRTLAFMFDKTLPPVGVPEAGESVTAPELEPEPSGGAVNEEEKTGASCALFASALSNGTLGNEEKPGSLHTLGVETLEGMSKENAGKTDSAWGRFCQNKRALGVACSVAAALAVVVVGVTLGPNASDAPDIDNPRQLDPELDSLRDFLNQLDATHHNASSNWDFEGSKSTTLGASKAMRAPTYDLCNLNVVTPQYNDAVDSFNDGDYRTAAKNFEKLVKKLKKNKSVDSETIDGAYWNWGVATLNAGDKTKAAKIFKNLEKRNLSPEMRRMTESALEECQN